VLFDHTFVNILPDIPINVPKKLGVTDKFLLQSDFPHDEISLYTTLSPIICDILPLSYDIMLGIDH